MQHSKEAPTTKINEQDRLDLRQELERVFNDPRLARIAMEAMPPIDYDRLATKDELNGLGTTLRGEMAELRGALQGEIAEVKGEVSDLRAQMVSVEASLTGQVVSVESALTGQVAGLEGRLMTEIVGGRSEMVNLGKDVVSSTRQMWAAQLASIVILVTWITAIL